MDNKRTLDAEQPEASDNNAKRVKYDGAPENDAAATSATASTSKEPASAASSPSVRRHDSRKDSWKDNRGSNKREGNEGGGKRGRGNKGGGGNGRQQGKIRRGGWENKPKKELDMDNDEDEDNNDPSKPKLPKKKVALLVGYSGLGYSGSQINPGVKTIESEVFDACVKAGCVSEDNSDNPTKVGLMRAARTDAGVSAAINVLNIKLILEPPSLPPNTPLEDHINSFMPPAVQIWSIIRVQGGFHSRTMCDSRMYNYSLPTYCFLEPKENTLMGGRVAWKDEQEKEQSYWRKNAPSPQEGVSVSETKLETTDAIVQESGATSEAPEVQKAEEVKVHGGVQGISESTQATKQDTPKEPSTFKQDQQLRKAYRIPPEVLERVRETMQKFLGSHNFWNFTVGKEFHDRSCQRVMKKLTVTDPFIVPGTDSEWISLKFHGQSFMLHQIRKMVGLLIFIVRCHIPPSLISETFGPARLNVPKAPSLGLMLEQPLFESYNRKIADSNRRAERNEAKKADDLDVPDDSSLPATPGQPQQSDTVRDPVSYVHIDDKVEAFKKEIVFKAMHEEEEKEDTYAKWLNLHDSQCGDDFAYLNSKGIIPPSAVLGKKKPGFSGDSNAQKSAQGEAGASKTVPSAQAGGGESEEEDSRLMAQHTGRNAADLEG